jgi:hypothetical protein
VLPLASLTGWRNQPRALTAVALWAVSFLVFYAFYEVTPAEWWCLRFVLPAFPAIILLALAGAEQLGRRFAAAPAAIALGVAAWTALAAPYWGRQLHVLAPSRTDPIYLAATRWISSHLPRESVVLSMVASGAIFYHTDFRILRWDCMSGADFRGYARVMQRSGRPVYALLFDEELQPAFDGHLPGRWEKVHTIKAASIWKWTGPG